MSMSEMSGDTHAGGRWFPVSRGNAIESLKAERKHIGIPEHPAQAHRLSGQRGDIATTFPSDDAVDVVVGDRLAVGQSVAGQRLAFGILDFDCDGASDPGGQIQMQRLAGEEEGLGKHLPIRVVRVQRGEAVEAQSAALQQRDALPVVAFDIQRHLGFACLQWQSCHEL
jgi:hypothetical protein